MPTKRIDWPLIAAIVCAIGIANAVTIYNALRPVKQSARIHPAPCTFVLAVAVQGDGTVDWYCGTAAKSVQS